MNEPEATQTIPPEMLADLEYAIQLLIAGKRDPEFIARVQARSERMREEVFQKHGLLNIAVDLIREIRDEE
jgi:hypothetical protein